jgi:hypothetical protein
VWGFLGNVTWVLSRNNAVVHCYVSLETQQFKLRACQQHCCARETFLWSRDCCLRTSIDFVSRLEIAECRRACVWLPTPFGWKTEFVSGKLREKHVCLEASWLQECEFMLEGRHKRSCWQNSIGVCVPRPCGSDVYVCSKSFWLCLTVVHWLFGMQ